MEVKAFLKFYSFSTLEDTSEQDLHKNWSVKANL